MQVAVRAMVTSCAAAACALVVAVPATAAPPKHDKRDVVVVAEPFENFVCANGSPVLSTFSLVRNVTTFVDQQGRALREVRHAKVTGFLYSEDGSRRIPYGGQLHRIADFESGTVTITGRRVYATLPGQDAAATGRVVFDFTKTPPDMLESGRAEEDFQAAVCQYFYG